jgi:hypothetical protein
MQVKFTYQNGGWGPGACNGVDSTFKSHWVDTAAIQGNGSVSRGGPIYQEDYECPNNNIPPVGTACWGYDVATGLTCTLRPLTAAINLTVVNGATETSPGVIDLPGPGGGWVQLRINPNPLTLKAIPVPVKPVSWTWIPNLGGDGQTKDQCSGTTKILCSMYFTETGKLITTAKINGVLQTDTLVVQYPEVRISLAKTSMRPSIRFYNLHSPPQYVADISKQIITVSVVDRNNVPMNSKSVTLTLKAIDTTNAPYDSSSAGHKNHPASTKPKGDFRAGGSSIVLNTGSRGWDTVTYVAPDPSGPVYMTATSSAARNAAAKISVEVKGLVRLPSSPTYDTTGGTSIHPDNMWMTPNHLTWVVALANEFLTETGKLLTFNDSSLPLGGLFDNVDATGYWTYPHRTHRLGIDTDVRTTKDPNLGQDEWDIIRSIWEIDFHGVVRVEGDHYHLTK